MWLVPAKGQAPASFSGRHAATINVAVATFIVTALCFWHDAGMKAKTGEFLDIALWACNVLWQPTFRNFTESYESWAYRNGLQRQLLRLEKQQLIEARPDSNGDRLHRLTEAGRLQALGGRDPEIWWSRPWDGLWRQVLFDVPETRSSTRARLRRYLRSHGFGYLQNSVWITPDPVSEQRKLLADGPVDVGCLIMFEARACGGESNSQIVAGAWNFTAINRGYARHHQILAQHPVGRIVTKAAASAFHRWLREEWKAWMEVMEIDPLLPEKLLPPDYAGRQAWAHRRETMAEAGEQIRSFELV
jgi:phenylacetic acid degradation operon negative regulatory protein